MKSDFNWLTVIDVRFPQLLGLAPGATWGPVLWLQQVKICWYSAVHWIKWQLTRGDNSNSDKCLSRGIFVCTRLAVVRLFSGAVKRLMNTLGMTKSQILTNQNVHFCILSMLPLPACENKGKHKLPSITAAICKYFKGGRHKNILFLLKLRIIWIKMEAENR